MDLVPFYQMMLKPPPLWRVSRVEVQAGSRRVDIWLEHEMGAMFACPDCGGTSPVYDHTPEREWRHLDTCEYETWLHACLPRVACRMHGVAQAKAPFSDARSGLTHAMERRCIDTLAECSRDGASRLTGLSWDMLDGVMARAVERGLARRPPGLPEWMGMDEKAVFSKHRYFTIITDLKEGNVVDVIDQRTKKALEPWFKANKEHLGNVKRAAIDMSAGYAAMLAEHMPQAEICFDHFHVTQKVNQAVDEVRKEEQRLMAGDDKADFFRSRHLFLYNQENVPQHRQAQFQQLKETAVKTSRAWAIKENFREIWRCPTPEAAAAFFKEWYWWATHSRLEPMRRAAHTIKRHWDGIANAIVLHVTNACTEGLNAKIEKIKRDAFGFRSKDKFRTAILFHCGGLDLYPATA